MKLTDTKVRNAKAGPKDYKLPDGGGMYLFVTTAGAKSWRLKYRIHGKEKLLTFGLYPDVSLAGARDARDQAKKDLREGRDPSIERKKLAAAARASADNTFEAAARAWHDLRKPTWSPVHAKDVLDSMEDDLFPALGKLPIREVDEALLLEALQKVEARGAIETAHRLRQRASGVFAYAAAKSMRTGDPAEVIKTLLKPKPPSKPQPALLTLPEVRQLMIDADNTPASPVTRLAHRLIALTAVRSAAQRYCRWSELEDLEGREPLWRIPAETMKLSLGRKSDEAYEHLVPLVPQAVDVFRAIRPLTGHLEFVFPNARRSAAPMTENAVRLYIINAGAEGRYLYRHTTHGWRSSFSTIMNAWRRKHKDGRPDDREVINLMLAHVAEDKVEGAYNREQHMDRRRELAQIWADMLLEDMPRAQDLLFGLRQRPNPQWAPEEAEADV